MARLFAVETPLPAAKPELKVLAAGLVGDDRPGDWAQGLMDLGATICRPKAPLCDRCPVSRFCVALKTGAPETYPRKTAKADRPRRFGTAYVLTRGGDVALVRRPDKGLLGGMLALPTGAWGPQPSHDPPVAADWRPMGEIEHVFTHFSLTLQVMRAQGGDFEGAIWTPAEEAGEGLPSVFLKALRQAMNSLL